MGRKTNAQPDETEAYAQPRGARSFPRPRTGLQLKTAPVVEWPGPGAGRPKHSSGRAEAWAIRLSGEAW
eukprot:5649728-Alexandrium_andersonii.AAC.1